MKKLNLFLLVAGFFVFSSCTERLEHNEEKSSGNVVINLSSVNAERGASPYGYESVDISKVKEWKLTFSPVPPFNGFPDEVRTIKDKSGAVTIGVGEYDLFVEGSYTEPRDNGEFTYKLGGACSGIVVEEGNKNTVPVSVLVGPKKTTEGKGSFSATMTFMQGKLNNYYEKTIGLSPNALTDDKSKRFKAELVSRKTGEIVYSTHSGEKLLVAVADTGDSSVTVKSAQTESEPNKISSGYYYFRFYADFAPVKLNDPSAEITPVWKEVSIGDNLVEIGDGLSTSWPPLPYSDSEPKLLSFPDDVTRYCYYASEVDGSKENNGISLDAPGELYEVLDTIYNNPMVQNAEINYSYTNSIRFDVSKIGSGKTVEIKCTKKGSQEGGGDTPIFTLYEDSSVLFNMHAESITLTSTGGAKGVKIKEGTSSQSKFSLENGVYLDLTSLTAGESIKSVNLYLDVDDIEYYKKNPVIVSGVSLSENNVINNSYEYYDKIKFAGDEQANDKSFNFIFSEKKISSERFEYFADSPVVGVMYSHEADDGSGYNGYIFSLYNATFDSTPKQISDNISVSAWCSDENGNIYAAAFDVADKKPSTAPYFIKYEKQVKGASFSFVQKTLGDYKVENLPASMCTDGKSIWYVNSAAKINPKDTSDSFSLFDAGSWISNDSKVYKVSIMNPAPQEPLDFSALFNNGKVTAVYYCDGALYVAGFKSELKAKYKWAGKTEYEIYNRTFSVYKFAEPDNITSAVSLSDVSAEYTVYTDASELERKKLENEDVRVRSYSSITDMAVVGGKVYVLENTYMTTQSGDAYPTAIVTGTLRNITDKKIYTGYTIYNSEQETPVNFVLPRKILAVVPKKLKLVLCDSGKEQNCYYNVDLNDADNVSIVRENASSGYCFDSFPTGSALIGKPIFDNNSVYIKQSSKDALVSK